MKEEKSEDIKGLIETCLVFPPISITEQLHLTRFNIVYWIELETDNSNASGDLCKCIYNTIG